MTWQNQIQIEPKKYLCGHCYMNVASNLGYNDSHSYRRILICPNCTEATYFNHLRVQFPGNFPGNAVQNLPEELEKLYAEARICCSVNAYTASVLVCRKMLMNIAVQQGAAEGLKFIQYVDHLATSGFIPPNGRGWVDHIRRKGNEATHEIALMSSEDALELITFTEMLLKFIYEFPARIPSSSTVQG